MTIPTTRPSVLSRARASFARTSPTDDRSPARRGSLLAALLMTAAVALTSAFGAANAHGAAPSASTASAGNCADKKAIFVTRPGRWRCQNLYMARVALDGRFQPGGRKVKTNYLKAGEWVNIRCQAYDYDGHTGERLGLYDKVGDVFVPDKYMRTLYTGRIPGAPVCDPQPDGSWRP
jgi:hypothetical protein